MEQLALHAAMSRGLLVLSVPEASHDRADHSGATFLFIMQNVINPSPLKFTGIAGEFCSGDGDDVRAKIGDEG